MTNYDVGDYGGRETWLYHGHNLQQQCAPDPQIRLLRVFVPAGTTLETASDSGDTQATTVANLGGGEIIPLLQLAMTDRSTGDGHVHRRGRLRRHGEYRSNITRRLVGRQLRLCQTWLRL